MSWRPTAWHPATGGRVHLGQRVLTTAGSGARARRFRQAEVVGIDLDPTGRPPAAGHRPPDQRRIPGPGARARGADHPHSPPTGELTMSIETDLSLLSERELARRIAHNGREAARHAAPALDDRRDQHRWGLLGLGAMALGLLFMVLDLTWQVGTLEARLGAVHDGLAVAAGHIAELDARIELMAITYRLDAQLLQALDHTCAAPTDPPAPQLVGAEVQS